MTTNTPAQPALRMLTIEEMDQVSGGARNFNPQPDPPGVVAQASRTIPPDPY